MKAKLEFPFWSVVRSSAPFNPLPLPPASTPPWPSSPQACTFVALTPLTSEILLSKRKIYLLLKSQVSHKSWLLEFMKIRCRHAFRGFFNY